MLLGWGFSVKITDADFVALTALVTPLVTDEVRRVYREGRFPRADRTKDVDRRLRWDVYAAAMRGDGWQLQDRLYAYLTDAHVDTALRRIVAPLDLIEVDA